MTKSVLKTTLPSTIRSKRLVMRPLGGQDVAQLVVLANNKKIADVLARLPHPYTEDDANYFINLANSDGEEKIWAITLDNQLIGVCGLTFSDEISTPELGYWLGEPHWGQGIGSEAISALLNAVKETKNDAELFARCLVSNKASAALLAKCGFAHQKTLTEESGLHADKEMHHFLFNHRDERIDHDLH
ncbi:GNAT family N-acetyltransferase [Maritalea sp. S77]|uniref:GNAT family N-acetyltransferase n=1 Tax=Maritalea sp. S77 TaxID=3415125 RepID=UPI003C7ACADC